MEDSRIITFSIPGKPFGKQRPRVVHKNGFSKAYTPHETLLYENLVRQCYLEASDGYVFPPESALKVKIIARYEIPKSTPKSKSAEMAMGSIRPTKKPDVDNICKVICDSLNGIAYRDDAAVVTAMVSKYYTHSMPRVEVTIEEAG